MPPALSDYQTAANAIYEPQKAAEATSLASTRTQNINTLEAQKGQVSTDYQSAIEKLTQSVQDQSAQINQLYSQRLGGNFSGLQGNDMGKMFSRANQTQGIIEQTRLNKLNQIATGETNVNLQYNTDVGNLTSKYGSLESQYAQSAYGAAVKAQRDQANSDRNYALSVARLNLSASRAAKAAQPKTPSVGNIIAAYIKADSKYGDYNPNGSNYHRWQAAEESLLDNGYDPTQYKKELAGAFGTAADKKQWGYTGSNSNQSIEDLVKALGG